MLIGNVWSMNAPRSRVEWRDARDSIDLAEVVSRELGPPPGRRDGRSSRPWWLCPFHEDRNPSLTLSRDGKRFRCFGCNESGDAAGFVMKARGMTFPEAVAHLTGEGPPPSGTAAQRDRPKPRTRPPVSGPNPGHKAPGPEPPGLSPEAAAALVESAAARLWTPDGASALSYLTGPTRGLAPETIRAARLGVTPPLDLRGRPRGIVVPWFTGSAPTLIKIRQPEPRHPKHREVHRDRARLGGVYPGPDAIRPGRPLVVVEGEFDALLLGQELGELAGVVTLGSASIRPGPEILGPMLAAAPWFIATDADEAGDKAATAWPASARRVRPPGPYNDWTEAKAGGLDLRRWWGDLLAGVERPALFSWTELAGWRWAEPTDDDEPPDLLADEPPI